MKRVYTRPALALFAAALLFDVGEATLKPGGERAVGELTDFLNDYPERTVLIEGFTDSTGPESFNETLSQRRADAVRTALTGNGGELTVMRSGAAICEGARVSVAFSYAHLSRYLLYSATLRRSVAAPHRA